jgi:hypothetical protein
MALAPIKRVPTPFCRRDTNKEAAEWALEHEAEEKGLQLFFRGYKLYPLDKETVFFFGELRTPAVSIRSFLFRSADGGKTWRDVMSPIHSTRSTCNQDADRGSTHTLTYRSPPLTVWPRVHIFGASEIFTTPVCGCLADFLNSLKHLKQKEEP